MNGLNAAIEQFEAAMARLETAAEQFSERQRAAAEAAVLASSSPEKTDGGPVAEALRIAEAELTRLRLENDALRAVGEAAGAAAFERAAADAGPDQPEVEPAQARRSDAAE